MMYLIIFTTGLILGSCFFYNIGYQDGRYEEKELWKTKYLLAEKQNSRLWEKNLELMEIIKKHDRTVANCWDEKLEWKE